MPLDTLASADRSAGTFCHNGEFHMKRSVMTTALALLPAAAVAKSTLDRMEVFFEKINAASVRVMANRMIANGADPGPLFEAGESQLALRL